MASPRQYYRHVFVAAHRKYCELRCGMPNAIVGLRLIEQEDTDGSGFRNGARPSASDWVADFEICGAALNLREKSLFRLYYLGPYSRRQASRRMGIDYGRGFSELNKVIQEKVGAEVLRRQLWPVWRYFDIHHN